MGYFLNLSPRDSRPNETISVIVLEIVTVTTGEVKLVL